MIRLFILFCLSLGISLGQLSTSSTPVASDFGWFGEVGAGTFGTNQLTGGVGVFDTVATNTQLFGEITETTGTSYTQSTGIIFGAKSTWGKIKNYQPFTIVGFGGSLSSLKPLTSIPAGVTGPNQASVTALGTTLGLSQRYAAGLEYPLKNGMTLGVGMVYNKTNGLEGTLAPFVFVGKRF
jgi:hypothetical protein